MQISAYFTEGELDLALTLVADILSDAKSLEEISVSYDAGNELIKLKEKIEFYKSDIQK
jgi:hypothetical protein